MKAFFNSSHAGKSFLLPAGCLFFNQYFFSKKKKSFKCTIRVSKSLDPDQDRHFIGPYLGANCLQRLLAGKTSE